MKPLNSSERTSAYIQFIILFLFTIGFTIYCGFFYNKVEDKDRAYLEEKVKSLSNSEHRLLEAIESLDLIKDTINTLDKSEKNKFTISQWQILLYLGKLPTTDKSSVSLLNKKIESICTDWVYDKAKLQQVYELKEKVKNRDESVENLKSMLISTYKVSPNQLDALIKKDDETVK